MVWDFQLEGGSRGRIFPQTWPRQIEVGASGICCRGLKNLLFLGSDFGSDEIWSTGHLTYKSGRWRIAGTWSSLDRLALNRGSDTCTSSRHFRKRTELPFGWRWELIWQLRRQMKLKTVDRKRIRRCISTRFRQHFEIRTAIRSTFATQEGSFAARGRWRIRERLLQLELKFNLSVC